MKYLSKPIIHTNNATYITLIVVLAPLLNFLSGINVDIYSPSMPAITTYFDTSFTTIKNTISVTLLGWTIGALLFGVLTDSLGRKKILIYGLFCYVITSLLAPWCQAVYQLMVVRLIQGLTIASITICCRALILDSIKGPRYAIAILYTSIGYGVGPIVGPFIGGILQHYIGWKANFYALAFVGSTLLLILFLFIKESIPSKQPLAIKHVAQRFLSILKHRRFMAGVFAAGMIQIQIMLYPTVGPFIVENQLHKSVLVYGNTALIVGAGYLLGTLSSRFLLVLISPKNVCHIGFVVFVIGVLLSFYFSLTSELNILHLVLINLIVCVSAGLIFANIMGANLRQFPESAGISMAIQAASLLFIASMGTFIISHIHITHLLQLAYIFLTLLLLQGSVFFYGYQKIFDH